MSRRSRRRWTGPRRGSGPGALDGLADVLGSGDGRSGQLLRGVMAGALAGAAVAGFLLRTWHDRESGRKS